MITQRNVLISFLSVYFIAFLSIITLRHNSSIIVSESTYAIFNSSPVTLYELCISYLNSQSLLFIIPILLLLGISTLIFLIHSQYENQTFSKSILVGIIILLLSPSFIYHLLNISEGIFIIFLGLGLWYFLLRKQFTLSFVFILLVSTSHLEFVLVMVLLVLYFLRKHPKLLYSMIPVLILFSMIKQLFYSSDYFILPRNIFSVVSSFIFEFGNYTGVSIILLAASFIAFFYFFFKKNYFSLLLYVITMFLAIITQNDFLFNVLVVLFSSVILTTFLNLKWSFIFFKSASYSMISLLLFLSIFGFTQSYMSASPTEDDLLFYESISSYDLGKTIYLEDKTQQLTYYTNILAYPYTQEEERVLSQILYSTEIDFTYELLIENNITHVIVTSEFRKIYFNDELKGLLINVEDESYFRTIVKKDTYSIYEVI